MTATFRLNQSELNENFIAHLRAMFKEKEVLEISVVDVEEMDETDYICAHPELHKSLLDAMGRVERREGLIEVDLDNLS